MTPSALPAAPVADAADKLEEQWVIAVSMLAGGDRTPALRFVSEAGLHPYALHLRGLQACYAGQFANAVSLLVRASTAMPGKARIVCDLVKCLYAMGDLREADRVNAKALSWAPDFAEHHFYRALICLGHNDSESALLSLEESLRLAPESVDTLRLHANVAHYTTRYASAAASLLKLLGLLPQDHTLRTTLASVYCDWGQPARALTLIEQILESSDDSAQLALLHAIALHDLNRFDDSIARAQAGLALAPDNGELHRILGLALQKRQDLDTATRHFMLATRIRYVADRKSPPLLRAHRRISRAKLQHDIEQLQHLHAANQIADPAALLAAYQAALACIPAEAPSGASFDIPQPLLERINGSYNRLHHLYEPAIPDTGTVNPCLDAADVQQRYADSPNGSVWVDEFLSQECLSELRRYCLESTFWFDFNHVNGYLGATLEDGFCSPLLLRLAQDLRRKFPDIFRDYPLTKLWAFKYDSRLEGIAMHADEAAVNVNFWITPDSANLDPEHGGLVVWDREAPKDWDFRKYNSSAPGVQEDMQAYLASHQAELLVVPYRCNRAVIFNSDLLHRTDRIEFKPGYENRRINITMLFGNRVDP